MMTSVKTEVRQSGRHGKTKDKKGKVKVGHRVGKGNDRGKGRGRMGGGGLDMVEKRAQCRG